ncbi:rplO, partial [Ophiophagus hannah]
MRLQSRWLPTPGIVQGRSCTSEGKMERGEKGGREKGGKEGREERRKERKGKEGGRKPL